MSAHGAFEAHSVGVLGLGVIGRPIAERLVESGLTVSVYDVRAEPLAALERAGAAVCKSPAEVAARAEVVLSLVSNADQTRDVVCGAGGIRDSVGPQSIFVVGSTLGPAPVLEMARALAPRGCHTLDAPISGGYLAAAEGNLSVMVGGAQNTLERALPVLRAFARAVTRVGDVGAGQTAKLAHQLVCSVNAITLLEGLALGVAGGVDAAALKVVLQEGVANSAVLELWDALGPRWKSMLKATPPGATLSNLRKDMHLVLDLAREVGVPLYVATQASLIADSGHATGHDDPRL